MRLLAPFVFICALQYAVCARSTNSVSNSSSVNVIIFREEINEYDDLSTANITTLIKKILPTLDSIIKNGTPLIYTGIKVDGSKNKNDDEDVKNSNDKDKSNAVLNKYGDQSDEQSNVRCTEKNEHHPIAGSCDSFIRCQNGTAEVKQCPDGLRYNRDVNSNEHPCQYNLKCPPGTTTQPAQPNDVCPNKYGYFKTVDRFNCSSYRICENGTGYDYTCPIGLAFSSSTSRCEFADTVPECNVEEYLGFQCPKTPDSQNVDVPIKYSSSTNCNTYFSCINNKPRPLKCDEFFGFDSITQSCIPAFNHNSCSEEQKHKAATALRLDANGNYVVRDFEQHYYDNRNINISFKPANKKILNAAKPVI